MKTYACPGCGDRVQTDCEIDCRACNRAMHSLDGIISGSGCYAIWRDGREVWSGTGLEAVTALQQIIATGSRGFVTCESSPDEKKVVAKFRTLEECQAFYRALAFASGR